MTNYITNAIKYWPMDSPVEVGVEVETPQATVWVHDKGPGLPPEEQERVWERFHELLLRRIATCYTCTWKRSDEHQRRR